MMKKKKSIRNVCVFTATRAEFGLLHGVMDVLRADPHVRLQVLVGGAHLSRKFGYTVQEVEGAGFRIDEKVRMLAGGDTPQAVCQSMGRGLAGFGAAFARLQPDLLLVLGDRYETLCVTAAAVVSRVPVAHVHGGETSEGTMDEVFRHAITKMSHLHFTACAVYARRIIRMGEAPARVFVVGSPGVENIRRMPPTNTQELAKVLGFDPREPFLLATMHPATHDADGGVAAADAMLEALDEFPNMRVVLTAANADPGGQKINHHLHAYAAQRPERCRLHASLGARLYLATMAYCQAMVGNSSSGIIEAPSLHVPTVNIGDRQRGRLHAASVIDCPPKIDAIATAIRRTFGAFFRRRLVHVVNPYEGRAPSATIARLLANFPLTALGPKSFYEVKA